MRAVVGYHGTHMTQHHAVLPREPLPNHVHGQSGLITKAKFELSTLERLKINLFYAILSKKIPNPLEQSVFEPWGRKPNPFQTNTSLSFKSKISCYPACIYDYQKICMPYQPYLLLAIVSLSQILKVSYRYIWSRDRNL